MNYRVTNGERIGKTNPNEAKAIVALLQACLEQPEYAGKSFGIISLLGDEQVKKLQEEIYKHIDAKVCSERRILCGNASNFQGDERDVIFLSVVDCANGGGPIAKQGFGVDDAYRKRYNVAVSRAKDQLWVVDSLDSANDLKPGDIRKMLIDFSLNPESIHILNSKIEEKSESPFEASVAKYLAMKGYHLVQQWEVGAYRLDMVAVCGRKKIAIECDGERYHSGENKIREDMERQTILERLGWRFIRIRGSEYYRNPEKTMERVVAALGEQGIEPEEDKAIEKAPDRVTELLQRVKQRAHTILGEEEPAASEMSVIAAALDLKNDVMGAKIEQPKSLSVSYIGAADSIQLTPKVKPALDEKAVEDGSPRQEKFKTTRKMQTKNRSTKSEQLSLFDKETTKDILEFLQNKGIQYIDKRSNGGSLWIIGGQELLDVVAKAKEFGYVFHFKKEGGRVTKNQPGWWTK